MWAKSRTRFLFRFLPGESIDYWTNEVPFSISSVCQEQNIGFYFSGVVFQPQKWYTSNQVDKLRHKIRTIQDSWYLLFVLGDTLCREGCFKKSMYLKFDSTET